jgi:hypothetical protein
MNVDDYLIDQSGIDFDAVFQDWRELLPESFSVWLINRFADMFLVLEDGSISMLDVGAGQVRSIAPTQEAFCQMLDDESTANELLMIPLVDSLVAAGISLGAKQCYSFKCRPPILGGEYGVENTEVCDIHVHYSLLGQIATQAKDLPEGTKIDEIKIE